MTGAAEDAVRVAVKALARRELSGAELVNRIRRAGYSEDEATKALDALRGAGYQSDERAARERARVLSGRNLGDSAIRADLRRRGLDSELIEQALAELPPETERAEALTARLGRGRRLADTLARKGFGEDTVWAVAGADVADAP